MSALCVLPLALGAFTPAPVRHAVAGRHASPCMMAEPLRTFLEQKAQVAPKFVDRVLEICDEEMIGEVSQLEIAQKAGLLPKLFKPVIALGIEAALGAAPDVSPAAAVINSLLKEEPAAIVQPKLNLEAEPYYDISKLPLNTYKAKTPLQGSITSVKRVVSESAPGEVCHIKINSGSTFKYWEGQSLGVVPPGINPKNGKPNSVRLYSIASTRYGDDLDGETVSLCVRRAVYWDKELGREDPAKKGVCSNFLCDASPNTPVTLTGPTGKVMLMPESNPAADVIMVATGTGIAPYRGFLRRLFVEETPSAAAFSGLAWLFLGVSTTDALLYDDDWQAICTRKPDNFRLTYAISREQTTPAGGKMYVQERLVEHADEVFDRLDKGAHMYFCGLKGMMPGINEALEAVATSKGIVWAERLEALKAAGQWHVEVY